MKIEKNQKMCSRCFEIKDKKEFYMLGILVPSYKII